MIYPYLTGTVTIFCIPWMQKILLKTWNILILHGISENTEHPAPSRWVFQRSCSATVHTPNSCTGCWELPGIAHGREGELWLHIPAVLCSHCCKKQEAVEKMSIGRGQTQPASISFSKKMEFLPNLLKIQWSSPSEKGLFIFFSCEKLQLQFTTPQANLEMLIGWSHF